MCPPIHVMVDDRELVFTGDGEVLIGADPSCDVRISGDSIAPRHARLQCIDGHWRWVDLSDGATRYGSIPVARLEIRRLVRLTLGGAGGVELTLAPEAGSPEASAAEPDLVMVGVSAPRAGETFGLERGLTIGRDARCDVRIDNGHVSRLHARISWAPGVAPILEDLGSKHGTLLNEEPVSGGVSVQAGDRLRIGDAVFDFIATAGAPPPEPQSPVPATTEHAAAPPPPAVRQEMPEPRELPGAATWRRVVSDLSSLRRRQRSPLPFILAGLGAGVLVAVVGFGAWYLVARERSLEEIVASVEDSTVLVSVYDEDERFAAGTGWVLDADAGLIVTNHHVIAGSDRFSVLFRGEQRDAVLVGTAACNDVALLRVDDASGMVSMDLGSQSDLRRGETVAAVGYPSSLGPEDTLIATGGIVSVVRTSVDVGGLFPNMVQTDAAINGGNSGGPLLDQRGRIVGMNTLTTVGAENQGYAIGIDHVAGLLPGLRQGQSSDWGGLHYLELDPQEARTAGLPNPLVIAGAYPGSPAEAAGIADNDWVVVAVEGHAIESDDAFGSYCRALEAAGPDPVALSLQEIVGDIFSERIELGEPREVELDVD